MKQLLVDIKDRGYEIYFESDFSKLTECFEKIKAPKKLLIVTDSNVSKLYAKEVSDILTKAGYDVDIHSFKAGEQSKNTDTILGICGACLKHGMDRKSMIVALGGGVVGDMAGFAAAIFMRGINFVQIPTTLLSQSDSSVGGKTGIDFMGAKNILGAFHQPKLVYINVDCIKTLPEREFICGMGEVIKHGIIRDKEFFDFLADNRDDIKKLDNTLLLDMAYKNCSIKADVVVKDEFESGLRADLNFGHTFGHAVEAYADFSLSHGECVGLGMIAASYTANKRGILSDTDFEKIKNVLKLYGFKTKIEINSIDDIYNLMKKDKKKSGDTIKFVLPTSIGTVIHVSDVEKEEIFDALGYIKK